MKHPFAAGLAGFAALAGAATTVIAFGDTAWNRWGWITVQTYRAEHADVITAGQTQQIFDLLEDLKEGQDANRDQWECDELDEDIPDLQLKLLDESLADRERVKIHRELQKKQDRWDKLDCTRFVD